eukprot:346362_1
MWNNNFWIGINSVWNSYADHNYWDGLTSLQIISNLISDKCNNPLENSIGSILFSDDIKFTPEPTKSGGNIAIIESLPNTAFTASSYSTYPLSSAKLSGYGWVPGQANTDQWLLVDLGRTYYINAILIMPRAEGSPQFVKTFNVSYSLDNITFNTYAPYLVPNCGVWNVDDCFIYLNYLLH